jgi:ADP-heptose:LPS heptosyltransferase/glycosyltransferase involved in cell wall biosynthesis
MRILIDLQALQTGSRLRGIGRYATALAKAIIKNRGDHEIWILLNGLFEDAINPIKEDFASILPADHIVVFSAPSPAQALVAENAWRIDAAELIREWMINALTPDVLLIVSLFEGPSEPGIVSIGQLETKTKIAVILHDLIPFLDPERYLDHGLGRQWYYSKINFLRSADLLLAVSDSSRREAIDALGFDSSRVVTIESAADERFTNVNISLEESRIFLEEIGIRRRFIMHASKIEPRKNFEGLIRAFAHLSYAVRNVHQLVLVGEHRPDEQLALRRVASDAGLASDDLVFAGHVSDSELTALYSLCTLFVFPSFHEGFGLPALEAMCCGAAVIGSNATSVPEVIGREDALFDPYSDQSIAAVIERALTDAEFHESLRAHALQQSKRFSWDRTAQLALRGMEGMVTVHSPTGTTQDISRLLAKIAAINVGVSPERKDLVAVADCISRNERAVNQRILARGRDASAAGDEGGRGSEVAEKGGEPYDATFVRKLYHMFHDREPDPAGFEGHLSALRSGRELHELVEDFLNSEEFSLQRPRRQRAPANAAGKQDVSYAPSAPEIEVIRHEVWLPDDRPRILLLKLDHIGDFVMTLDAFRIIRDTWPKAHITLVCGPWNKSIAERSGLFDSVIGCNFYPDITTDYDGDAAIKQGIEEYLNLGLGYYDLAVDLRYFEDNRVLLSHTDAKYRAGYAANGVPLDLGLPPGPEPGMMAHIGGRTMALAAAVTWTFGIPAGGARDGLLNGRAPVRLFKEGVVVGISPGTRNAIRSWGRERFGELARTLQGRGDYRIVLIGGNADRADTRYIADSIPNADVVDLAGTLAIADIPPVFAGLDLFIGGETGTTHMAALMGVPTLCIYSGQTNVNSFRPVGAHVVTLRGAVECAPCFLISVADCPWNKRCMDILPARVAAEAIALRNRVSSKQNQGPLQLIRAQKVPSGAPSSGNRGRPSLPGFPRSL